MEKEDSVVCVCLCVLLQAEKREESKGIYFHQTNGQQRQHQQQRLEIPSRANSRHLQFQNLTREKPQAK